MDHACRRRPRLLPAALLVLGLVLGGCSSGGGEPPGPSDESSQEETTGPPAEETGGTTGDTSSGSDSGGSDSGGDSGGGGGFDTAGRVSGSFAGAWPLVKLTLRNPSSETYTGTASFSDCTPGPNRWSTAPPDQSVSLPPNGDGPEITVTFPDDDGKETIPEHTVCVRLTGRPTPLVGTVKDENFTPPDQPEEPEPQPDDPAVPSADAS
ncbi:hypothetical protein AB0M57_32340 [Streptomyces sp. NPDC051597]|uniref:hypothetical protein n=1 Tax=Streptomyces sp. NPDC051597 TaxID=3155049 RepID=UPI00343AF850